MGTPSKKLLSLKQKKLKLSFRQPKIPNQDSLATLNPTEVTPPEPVGSPVVFSGLCNLGNTCYSNCILQVLRFCPQFSKGVARLSEAISVSSTAVEGGLEDQIEVTFRQRTEGGGGERDLVTCLHMVRICTFFCLHVVVFIPTIVW